MNDFIRDDEWQRRKRELVLTPLLYQRYAHKYHFSDAAEIQKSGIDTVVQWEEDSSLFYIDEKIVRWPTKRGKPYECFCLETVSNTDSERHKDGWMVYGKMSHLLYCFETATLGLDCYLINFPQLYNWFWPRESSFPWFQMENTINRTGGRVVKIKDVTDNVSCRHIILETFSTAIQETPQ